MVFLQRLYTAHQAGTGQQLMQQIAVISVQDVSIRMTTSDYSTRQQNTHSSTTFAASNDRLVLASFLGCPTPLCFIVMLPQMLDVVLVDLQLSLG